MEFDLGDIPEDLPLIPIDDLLTDYLDDLPRQFLSGPQETARNSSDTPDGTFWGASGSDDMMIGSTLAGPQGWPMGQGLPPIVSLCQAPGGLQTTDISTVPSLNVPLPAFEELLGLQRTSGSSSGIDRRALPQTQNQQPLEASAPRNDTGVVSSAYLSAFYNMGAHGCTHHNPQIQPAQAMDPISWEQVPYQHYVETQQLNGQYSDVLPRDLRCELQPAESPHSGLNPDSSHGESRRSHDVSNSQGYQAKSEGSSELANSAVTGAQIQQGDWALGDFQFAGPKVEPECEDNQSEGKKGQRRRNRTEHQQNLNKLAQQRYRERKRQKALETERAANTLASQVQDFNLVKERYNQLNAENETLQRHVAATDAELARLRAEAEKRRASGVHEGVVDSQEKADELVLEVHRKAEQLRSCLVMLEQCLSRSSAADPALASKLSGELEVFIEEIQKLFVKVQSFEGVDLWRQYAAFKQKRVCPANCNCSICQEKAATADIASLLCLTDGQCRKISFIREEYAKKFKIIYDDRQKLNVQAVSVMLPQDDSEAKTGEAGNFAHMGFYKRAQNSVRVADLLELLKANLRAEQRTVAEVDFITFKHILTPSQGASFILHAYPGKADSVALGFAVRL